MKNKYKILAGFIYFFLQAGICNSAKADSNENTDENTNENTNEEDNLPFAKGDIELGIGLGGAGNGDSFSLVVGGEFAYYVIPRLAAGIDIHYNAQWGDLKYPQSMTVLPFFKFVLIRSYRFAPYLLAGAGRDFQWGGTDDPSKGYLAVGAWLFGGGAGVLIGVSSRMLIKFQVLALYYLFDKDVLLAGEDDPQKGKVYFPITFGLIFGF